MTDRDFEGLSDPVSGVEWVPADSLKANGWNPNVNMGAEFRLLELSILKTGWVFPILVDSEQQIIDGFHRWRLAQDSKALRERYDGNVPVVVLPVSRAEAMLITVRMNRAKGTHVAVRMADLVKEVIDDHGYTQEDVAREIGATKDEVVMLYENSLFKAKNLKGYKYSKAWVPYESRHESH